MSCITSVTPDLKEGDNNLTNLKLKHCCLQDAVADLEQGIVTERQCTQLLEQHEAAQAWLREQVKSLEPPAADRQGLHSAVNTLKVRTCNALTQLYKLLWLVTNIYNTQNVFVSLDWKLEK